MAINLSGLNYDSKLSIDDLKFAQDENEKAILERTQIVFGFGSIADFKYGILDAIDPKDIVEDEITRPLLVYASSINPLNINITAGRVVTSNGSLVYSPFLIEDLQLARIAAGDINVVYIENEIIDGEPIRKTRYNEDQYTRRVQSLDKIRVALLSDFQNSVLFPPTRIENIVSIAIVTVAETISGLELQFDYTESNYSFNRPWYSPVDIEHRSQIGGGVSTNSNPHGTTFNDLVSGDLTLYDQLLSIGWIQARDDSVNGVAGTNCAETIASSRILTDGTGITSGSRFGGIGAKYIVLSGYPVKITAFYLTSHKGRAIAFDWIIGTKILVLPQPETFTSEATIHYNQVYALQPPAQIFSNSLAFGSPLPASELVYTEGVALTDLTNPVVEFDGSGKVPRNFTIYSRADGTFLKTPQPIQTTFLLDDIANSLTPISASIFGPAKLSIGLADATPVSTMQIVIRMYGKDINDNEFTEDITFNGSSWVSVSLPGVENPNQFIKTMNVFRILTAFQVISRVDDGPNSKIQLWAELETFTTTELNRVARVASVSWDGLAISQVKDIRQISTTIPAQENRYLAAAQISGLGGSEPIHILTEDFKNSIYKDTTTGYQVAVAASFQITVNDYTRIQAGDQVAFPTGKTITAIVSGSPNRAIGEYLAASGNQDTRDDIILTVNDVTFNSGFTALAEADPNLLTCTSNVLGARGNGPVSEVDFDPSALLISGDAVGGIDAFGESFLNKHQEYINTTLPSVGVYDVTSYRDRYLSAAIAVQQRTTLSVILHGVQPPSSNYQLRTRVALDTSTVWQPWEVITGNGASFTITKALAITKIQIEIFGRVAGFSLYEG